MQGDPTGSGAAPTPSDTADGAADALGTTEPTEAASGAAEGQGDGVANDPTTPPGDTPAEDRGDDEGEPDEADAEETEGDEPEGERKLSRKERQRLREEERIAAAVQAEVAKRESERAQAEEARRQQEQSQEAARKRNAELAEFVGEPDTAERPGTIRRLDAEIADLNAKIRAELTNPQGLDLDGMVAEVAKKEADKAAFVKANQMAGRIEEHVWSTFGADFAAAANFPEFGDDPAKKARYLNAQGGVAGALRALVDVANEAKDAHYTAEIAKINEKNAAQLKAAQADRDAWRVRAGGGEAVVEQDGTPISIGAMTREQFLALPREQKERMRRDQPAAVAAIYQRSA